MLAKFALEGISASSNGALAVVDVTLLLERLDHLESGKDRKATHVQDRAALAVLAERGIDAAKRKELAALVARAQAPADTSELVTAQDAADRDDSSMNTTGTTNATQGAGGAGGSASNGVGGGVPATACLDGTNCQTDLDCNKGYHCNPSLTPLQCEKLYCGGAGTVCSDVSFCAPGLKCFENVCVDQAFCFAAGESCKVDGDCCSGGCASDVCVDQSTCAVAGKACSAPGDCCSNACYGAQCACAGCADGCKLNVKPGVLCKSSQIACNDILDCYCNGVCASACAGSFCSHLAMDDACKSCVQTKCSAQQMVCGMTLD